MNIKKKYRMLMAGFTIGIIPMACLSEGDCPSSDVKEGTYRFQVQVSSLSGSGDTDSKDKIERLDAYLYNREGQNARRISGIEIDKDGTVRLTLNTSETGRIYFIANYPEIPESEIPLETDLANRVTQPTEVYPDPYFMTAIYEVPTDAGEGERKEKLSLTRSVSRIDLNVGNNALLEIDSVTIDHVADRSYLFSHPDGNIPKDVRLIAYTKKTGTSPLRTEGARQGLFYVYENGMQTSNLTVYGRYNGVKTQANLKIPGIERNRLYTIELQPVGQTIGGTIKVEDWKTGTDIPTGNKEKTTIM